MEATIELFIQLFSSRGNADASKVRVAIGQHAAAAVLHCVRKQVKVLPPRSMLLAVRAALAGASEAIEVATIILAGVFGEAPFVRKVAYEAVYPGKGIFPHR